MLINITYVYTPADLTRQITDISSTHYKCPVFRFLERHKFVVKGSVNKKTWENVYAKGGALKIIWERGPIILHSIFSPAYAV
jgi:hypothetical protein